MTLNLLANRGWIRLENISRKIGRLLRSVCGRQHTKDEPYSSSWYKVLSRILPFWYYFISNIPFPTSERPWAEMVQYCITARERLMSKTQNRQFRLDSHHKLTSFKVRNKDQIRMKPLTVLRALLRVSIMYSILSLSSRLVEYDSFIWYPIQSVTKIRGSDYRVRTKLNFFKVYHFQDTRTEISFKIFCFLYPENVLLYSDEIPHMIVTFCIDYRIHWWKSEKHKHTYYMSRNWKHG